MQHGLSHIAVLDFQSKQKYFYALGIFGLAGLIPLAIILATQEDSLRGLEYEARQKRETVMVLNTFLKGIDNLIQQMTQVNIQMPFIKNRIDIIIASISNIKDSVNELNNSFIDVILFQIYGDATLSGLYDLANDAS